MLGTVETLSRRHIDMFLRAYPVGIGTTPVRKVKGGGPLR
jgi:hypothetical protein